MGSHSFTCQPQTNHTCQYYVTAPWLIAPTHEEMTKLS